MKFENRTPYPALLFRKALSENRLAASVFARVTYDLRDGALHSAAEQRWKVSRGPWKCEYGPMDGDDLFRRGGVDLMVLGHARAPGGRETTRVDVTVEAGSFRRRSVVFGDRVWERVGDRLIPGAPKPFKEIPLTMAHAYGGKDRWDGLDVPYPDNPEGKGYCLEEGAAIGRPLPNIEDPDHLVRKWDDRPEPVGFGACPITSGLRMRNSLEVDEKGKLKAIRPTLYNSAFPRFILQRLQPGESIRVEGVSESGALRFSIPNSPPIVRLRFGAEVDERPLGIDQVGIETDAARVFIGYRFLFRYRVVPRQLRSCELAAERSS